MFDNCLTFDSLLRPIRQGFFFLFFMLAIWWSGNKEKTYSNVTFLKPFKGGLSPQLSTSDTTSAVLIFSFYLCLFFSSFFGGLTQSAETSSLPSELNWRKITFQCQKCQPPNLTAALPRCEPSTLHFSAVLRISSAGSASLLCFLPLGHCRYILLYSFRMCSTVNYQLYVILEEKRRARGKQQSHQSLWLHNSCHPYSNKIYHIVNHGEANVCECVCAHKSADNSEVIN